MTQALTAADEGSSLMATTAWCLVSFLKGDHPPRLGITEVMIPVLVQTLFRTNTEQIITDLMAGLSLWTADASDVHLLELVESCDFIAKLMELVHHKNSARIGATSIRILGLFLSSQNNDLSQCVVNAGILSKFLELIDHDKPVIRKEVVWSLSNIVARSPEHVQYCLELGLIEKLIGKMATDPELKVRNEAIWAMSNAFYKGTPEQA